MPSPSVDIIVPVWNNLFETRACLAAITTYSPEARLIVIDNGSSRETELMLEEFSESLAESNLFITTPRNIGLVPALNVGLAQSGSDFAVIVRPQVLVSTGWLDALLESATAADTGIVTPLFSGKGAPQLGRPVSRCSSMETFSVSFSTLLLRGEMHRMIGGFDEDLDGGEWCLRNYIRRAESAGYRTFVAARPELVCGPETVFGSHERRQELSRASKASYCEQWGGASRYCLYFGRKAEAGDLAGIVGSLVSAARHGHHFTLFLHRKQYRDFRRRGWHGLHTGVELRVLSFLTPARDLKLQFTRLQAEYPDLIPVYGSDGIPFPGIASAISFSTLSGSFGNFPVHIPSIHSAEVV